MSLFYNFKVWLLFTSLVYSLGLYWWLLCVWSMFELHLDAFPSHTILISHLAILEIFLEEKDLIALTAKRKVMTTIIVGNCTLKRDQRSMEEKAVEFFYKLTSFDTMYNFLYKLASSLILCRNFTCRSNWYIQCTKA